MKNKIGINIIIIILGIFGICLAQNTTNIENEIDDFDIKSAFENVQNLEKNLDEIIQQLYKLDEQEKGNKETISDKYRETRKEIVNVIQTINETSKNINEQLQKISTYKKLMLLSYKELQESRSGIQNTKQYIKDFSNFIYKLNNKLYNEKTNTIDDIKLIINSDNIPRTLANDYIVESMILQLNDLMNNFKENEEKQLETIKKLNEIKKKAKEIIKNYNIQIEKLQQKKNYLIQFMNLYKNDKIQRQININNFFESTKDVYNKSIELVKEIEKGSYKVNFDMEKKLLKLNTIENTESLYPIAWPIYPIEKIQTYFNDENFEKQYGIPHIGIQIKAEQGTPVYATRDGIVYFVADNENIGINRIMIVHTNGYISMYQYLNKIIVAPGDIVRRGQIIGYSGGEPGTKGAGFISKGANLTFIVFKNGRPIDPFEILDASIIKEKEALPDGYQIKYLRDKYARTIDISDLELMSGETLIERENQFLSKFGIGIYKQVAFREDVVKNTNIDKDVVICIAFAESTLGRYLSTPNNVGNVGNNDRGDRIGFYSAYAGARAIPLTLNNFALGNYHTINQLSRYGNKDGMIYASSPINRQTNVLKCLSQIKGYYIPEDFPFRTGPNPNINNPNPETIEFGESLTK